MTPQEAKRIAHSVARCFGYPRWLDEQLTASSRINLTTFEEEGRRFSEQWAMVLEHTNYAAAQVVVKRLLHGQIEWTYFGQMALFVRDRAARLVRDREIALEKLRTGAVKKLLQPIDLAAIAEELGEQRLSNLLRHRRESELSGDVPQAKRRRGVSKKRMIAKLTKLLSDQAEQGGADERA